MRAGGTHSPTEVVQVSDLHRHQPHSASFSCPILEATREPILGACRLAVGEQRVQDRDDGARRQPRPLTKRALPALLQSGRQLGARGRADVAVHAAHAGDFVTHPLQASAMAGRWRRCSRDPTRAACVVRRMAGGRAAGAAALVG